MKRKPQQQRGAAILLAMLIVTLVATLAAGMQWRQWRLLQQESAARAQSQTAWVLVGALDWARLILREDARSTGNALLVDHLGEPWAVPLQEAKLSSFLSADALASAGQDEAYLSGRIIDAQSKINLTNLVLSQTGQGTLSAPAYASLAQLYQQLNLPEAELKAWTDKWLQAKEPVFLRPQSLEQLAWLGVPPRTLALLAPYVTVLPQPTPINLNTASATVIAASVPGIDRAQAQHLVTLRATAPFQNVDEAMKALGHGIFLGTANYSVSSQYFEVQGRLRLGDWVLVESSLVQRVGIDVKTLWRRRL